MADILYNQGNQLVNRVAGYSPDKYEEAALESINYERAQRDDAAVFITEKKQYLMRKVIDKARDYYYGNFKNPKDEVTGEYKTWVPLTEWSVESVVKSVDLDTKDILVQPGKLSSVNVTPIFRALILDTLKKIGFGQMLNDLIRVLSRDGTVVVKTFESIDPVTKRKILKSKIIDLLNLWVDPSADSLQETSIIERDYYSEDQIKNYTNVWRNTQYINFSLNVSRLPNQWSPIRSKVPNTEIWERWGEIKKSWITKNDADDNTWIDGHIVASGLGNAQIIHHIDKNPREDRIKPYEEAWYKRLDGRWYGRGVAEMLFGLQEYANMVVNTRKSNNMVLQNGIFLIRKGSGLTPDMVSAISSGGGLPVTDIDRDVKQLSVQDYRQSSYADEDRINSYADRVTGSFDINRGEAGRASTSATATLTQDRNIRDTFVLVQEGIGFFVERLIVRQYLPMLKKILKNEDIIRVTGDADLLAFIDESIINHRLDEFKEETLQRTGFLPEDNDIQRFYEDQQKFLKSMGKNRFVKYFNTLFDENVDIDVTVTDERFNRVVAVQQLRDMLIAHSRSPVASKLNLDAIMREMLNLMGIKGELFFEKPQLPAYSTGSAQYGRLLKELPEGLPTEVTALENAAGLPQIGQSGLRYPDFQTRINVAAPLTRFGNL